MKLKIIKFFSRFLAEMFTLFYIFKMKCWFALYLLFSEIKLYIFSKMKEDLIDCYRLTSFFKFHLFVKLNLAIKFLWRLRGRTWSKWCMGIGLLGMFLSSVGLLEGYSHAGLNVRAFDVCVSSSGKLCHFLFAVHYLTSFAVLGGTYSRCMQQVRKSN